MAGSTLKKLPALKDSVFCEDVVNEIIRLAKVIKREGEAMEQLGKVEGASYGNGDKGYLSTLRVH